jgi:hypothetical protein
MSPEICNFLLGDSFMNGKEILYLAIPYIHDDPLVMDFRADVSDIIAADLAKHGNNVFAPISSWHTISKKYDLPGNWEYWKDFDEVFMAKSARLSVVALYGWKKSTGVNAEIKLAKHYNIKINLIDPTLYVKMLREEGNYFENEYIYNVYGEYDPLV